jgi:hypothetical protein
MRICRPRCPRAPRALLSAVSLLTADLAMSCGHSKPAEHAPVPSVAANRAMAARIVRPARWFPTVDSSEPRIVEQDPDGSLRLVERGLRLVEHPDGRIVRAEEILPSDGTLAVLHLPRRLGGGTLFSVTSEGATRLWRAAEWTSSLTPLVRLPFEAGQLVAGFDRLYAVSTRARAGGASGAGNTDGTAVGVDAATGALMNAEPLPPAAAYGAMAFSDGWVGAVEVDVRGVLVTFDAGASFHPFRASSTTPGVYEQGGRVVLGTAHGGYALEPSGELEHIDGPSESAVFGDLGRGFEGLSPDQDDTPMDEPIVPLEASVLGARPLEVAALRGYPDTAETAVVVANGTLARVALRDGRIVASALHAAPAGASCVGVRLFSGIGFVCGDDLGPTRVFAYEAPLTLAPVLELPEPRTVSASGRGALAIHGGCPGGAGPRADTFCIVRASGAWSQFRVEDYVGAERVVALADGRVVVLMPPRPGAGGAIRVVSDGSPGPARALSLAAVPSSIQELLRHGLWLEGLVEIEPGSLSGWVVGGTSFVGVRMGLDGKVTAGIVRSDAPRASFSGAVALVTDSRGSGYESTDGGATWSEMALPVTTDVIADAPADRERGCSPVGCGLGSWLRVGWGKAGAKSELALAADPPKPKPEPFTFVTWSLKCAPTGETEGPADVGRALPRASAARSMAPPSRSEAASELASSAWRTFLGAPGPERAPGDLGFDFGTEDQAVQLRGYAWGARGAAWDRTGSWLVRAANRFSVRRSVWSTAISRSPWADAPAAAEAFGSEPSHRVSNGWSAALDPVEEGGILFLRTGSTTEVSVAERGHALVTLHNADDFALDRPAADCAASPERCTGAVKVAGKWYLGVVPGPRSLQILRIDGGTLSVLASYPRRVDDPFARIVRTTRGDALGVWVIQRGQGGTASGGNTWFVHPVDLATGEADTPLVVPHDALSHTPRPCEPDESGWVLEYALSPSVAKLDLTNTTETPAVTRLEARLIAGPHGLCLDSLAAQVDGDPPKNLRPAGAGSRPRRGALLALTDRATDRRWGFRCAP